MIDSIDNLPYDRTMTEHVKDTEEFIEINLPRPHLPNLRHFSHNKIYAPALVTSLFIAAFLLGVLTTTLLNLHH